jgi:hypothetical protein
MDVSLLQCNATHAPSPTTHLFGDHVRRVYVLDMPCAGHSNEKSIEAFCGVPSSPEFIRSIYVPGLETTSFPPEKVNTDEMRAIALIKAQSNVLYIFNHTHKADPGVTENIALLTCRNGNTESVIPVEIHAPPPNLDAQATLPCRL